MKVSLKRGILFIAVGVALIVAAGPGSTLFEHRIDKVGQSQEFAKMLDQKTERALALLGRLQDWIERKGAQRTQLKGDPYFESMYRNEGIMLAAFRNDSLILWSNNSISPASLLRVGARGTEIYQFENGWYRVLYLRDGEAEYCAAILIKHSYPYENEYLVNTFHSDFAHEALVGISTEPMLGSVELRAGDQSFYLVFDAEEVVSDGRRIVFISFSLLGGLAIAFGLIQFVFFFSRRFSKWVVFGIFVVLVCALRYLSLTGGWPGFITQLNFFSPTVYASSAVFPSLLDFLVNACLLIGMAVFFRILLAQKIEEPRKQGPVVVFSLLTLLTFLYAGWLNSMVRSLVRDSIIPFDINNIIGLNSFSFIAIFSTAILYASFVLIADGILRYARLQGIRVRRALLIVLLATGADVIVSHLMGIRDLIFVLWPAVMLILLLYYTYFRSAKSFNLVKVVATLILFSGLASHNFLKYAHIREHSLRQILAEKLSVDDDPVAELLYTDLVKKLAKDEGVREVFEENELHTRETLEDYVLSRYFTGYWGKYDIKMYAFLGDSSLWGKPPAMRPTSFAEIKKQIQKYGEPSAMHSQLYYMYNAGDYTTYIAVLPLDYSGAPTPDGFLVFRLSSKLFPQQLGFPSLLIDQNTRAYTGETPYASARYVGGRLMSSRGNYPFRTHPDIFDEVKSGGEYIIKDGYEHLVKRVDPSTLVVLSIPLESPLDKATTYSYLCVLFGIALAIGLFIRSLFVLRSPLALNLNQKIQALLILLTLTSLFLFSYATKYYIEQKYREKNEGQISEKLQSILLEVKSKLGEEESLNYDMGGILNRVLSQFSYIFFTDINMYSPEGDLLASSQMRMFNEGLLSRKINAEAYAHIRYLDQVEYIHEERIGKLTYISGYLPFYNERGKLLAYINLPYFAKQTELDNEISNFLVSVINIFVLLFLLAILVGLFISQWITAPLSAIRKSLAGIELGKTNRMIGYQGSDEIGRLVREYNIKVAELEHNADKLAQSERESAWREMAKQVAHEIKNPLTPMKLNIQHLERSIEHTGRIDVEQIKRLTKNLVEQIDALSAIANAFSNFARMPQANMENIDLAELLQNVVNLYDTFDNVYYTNEIDSNDATTVTADRKQLVRVFNNLIKNALQSLEEKEKGWVKIQLKRSNEGYLVEISDNGTGIKDEDFNRIFVPNFTTKTRGMGLGLAMAKNIVEYSQGKIWFESREGKGSSFFVWLPA